MSEDYILQHNDFELYFEGGQGGPGVYVVPNSSMHTRHEVTQQLLQDQSSTNDLMSYYVTGTLADTLQSETQNLSSEVGVMSRSGDVTEEVRDMSSNLLRILTNECSL